MADVRLENVSKKYGRVNAVLDFSEHIGDGEFVSLLGPSGCGKTTTLRIIAGFEKATAGRVFIGDSLVSCSQTNHYLPPEKRNIGMVFQSYAVWPHMNVFDNVAYPLKVRGMGKKAIHEKAGRVLDIVHLSGLEKRLPNQLSGGQQQRVALARALIAEPSLLLLDEPLSNLDAKLRESMRFEIKDVQRRLGITVVYVTHDQAEAMVMSDRIVVMEKGMVRQSDVPRMIYERPADKFVADFIGLINFIEGTVVSVNGNTGNVQISGLKSETLFEAILPPGMRPGDRTILAIRPENIDISATASACGIRGKVIRRVYLGHEIDYMIEIGNTEVRATMEPSADDHPEGSPVFVTFKKVLAVSG